MPIPDVRACQKVNPRPHDLLIIKKKHIIASGVIYIIIDYVYCSIKTYYAS